MSEFKILTVTPFFPPDTGGISVHVQNLDKNLIKLGNEISIVAPTRGNQDPVWPDPVLKDIRRITCFYLPGWPYPTLRSVSIPFDLGHELKSIIQNGKFDIIHVHGHHYPLSWIAINAAHKSKIPSVLTLHGMYALNPNVLGGRSWLEDFFNTNIFAKVLSKTGSVIGLTPQITAYAKEFGTSSTKFYTIPNGVNTTLYKDNLQKKIQLREKYHIGKESKVVLFCGRFERVKGISEFVEASKQIAKARGVEIVLVGDGTLEPAVRSSLSGVERVHLFKWQPSETIHELFICSDIFALPSKFEALPITIIEAMNAGLHIVYSPVGGVPDILEKYSAKSLLSRVSAGEILRVVNSVLSGPIKSLPSDLAYAQSFDWVEIASKTVGVFSECAR